MKGAAIAGGWKGRARLNFQPSSRLNRLLESRVGMGAQAGAGHKIRVQTDGERGKGRIRWAKGQNAPSFSAAAFGMGLRLRRGEIEGGGGGGWRGGAGGDGEEEGGALERAREGEYRSSRPASCPGFERERRWDKGPWITGRKLFPFQSHTPLFLPWLCVYRIMALFSRVGELKQGVFPQETQHLIG